MFFVVELDSDIFKEKIIVPSVWLDKNNTFCLLPPTTDITEVERIAKTETAPKNGWQMHSVSFMDSFDTYSQAKENMKNNRKLPVIFELEDEEEKQQCHQKGVRKRKRPAFLENYSTDIDIEEETRSTMPPDNVSVERGNSMLDTSMIKVEPKDDTTPLESHHQRRKDTSKNLPGSHFQVPQSCSTNGAQTMQRVSTNCPCNSSCHKVILQSLATLQRQLDDNSRMLHQIMGQLTSNSRPSLRTVNTLPGTPVNFPVTLPIRELSDLQSLNDYLSDQHNFTQTKMNTDPRGKNRGRCLNENCDCSCYEFEKKSGAKCCYCFCPPTKHKKLGATENTISDSVSGDAEVITASLGNIPYFTFLGGSLPKQILRRLLETFLSNELCSKLNWKGRGDKYPFKVYSKIHSLIFCVTKQNLNGRQITLSDVENYIKDWLKLAPGRITAKKNQKMDNEKLLGC